MTTTTTPATTSTSGGAHGLTTVLIADKFLPSGVESIRALGYQVELEPDRTADDLPARVDELDPDILVVRSTKVRAPAFDTNRSLSLVVRAGAGYDNIDVEAASARGVFVANCPGKNALAVAELVWGLILACDRRIPDQTADLRAGIWKKKEYSTAHGLYGRTLGVVGLGEIGKAVVERAHGFGMRVIATSRRLTPEGVRDLGIEYRSSPIEVAAEADVVSIHVASTPETRHLVDAAFCRALKPGAIFVNTSRGAVVDADALTTAIREKGVRAGLDVYANQPAPDDPTFADPIVHEPCVYGTHHSGASTDQAQEAIADETRRIIETYVNSGKVLNCVNRAATSSGTCLLTVRHLNRPGVLAHVFNVLSQTGINVDEMENVICEGDEAACARLSLCRCPAREQMALIDDNPNILNVEIKDVQRQGNKP